MNFPLKSAWLTIPEEFNHCPTIFSILSTFRTVLSVQPRMVDVYFDCPTALNIDQRIYFVFYCIFLEHNHLELATHYCL